MATQSDIVPEFSEAQLSWLRAQPSQQAALDPSGELQGSNGQAADEDSSTAGNSLALIPAVVRATRTFFNIRKGLNPVG